MVMSFRRWATGQGDQVGFAPALQLPLPVRLDPVLQHPSQPSFGKAALDVEHRVLDHIQGLSHPGRRSTCIGLEQNPSPSSHPN